MGLRITTWNVNGIRNPFSYQPWRESRTFQAMFDTLEADIVVMQETKIQRKDLQDDMVLVPGWDVFFSLPKYKKGYSGVAIYTRSSKCCPIRAEEGITGILCPPSSSTRYRDLQPENQIGGYPRPGQLSSELDEAVLDSEGRCVILEFPAFVLIGVYSPATRDDTRTEFRESFQEALDVRVRNLVAMGKEVFLCGDLNIVRSVLDTAGLAERLRKEGMSLEEYFSLPSRRFLNQLVFGGDVFGERDEGREQPVMWDLCREFHPDRTGMYTCWEVKKNARPGNYGSRIDYVLCTSGIKDWFMDANIQEGLLGSDHCPVYATLSDTLSKDGTQLHITDLMNPEGMFKDGVRQREWSTKDLLPLSAKLIPEFNNRRSIRDMFSRASSISMTKPSPTPTPGNNEAQSSGNSGEGFFTTPTAEDQPQDNSIPATQSLDPVATAASKPQSVNPIAPKRQAEATTSSNRPQKKTKASLTKQPSATSGSGGGQRTLMGFFKPKNPPPSPKSGKEMASMTANPPADPSETTSTQTSTTASPQQKQANTEKYLAQDDTPEDCPGESSKASSTSFLASPQANKTKIIDPVQSKESWSKLLGGRILPKCEHGDECQIMTTKKPGVNRGRSFYVCPRPLGPSGDKEVGTEFRCRTFIWSSDWSGRRE
ncbi:Endonuclease/exonuclease/phosphatase [Naviculisporaceae sp. PSN 640]